MPSSTDYNVWKISKEHLVPSGYYSIFIFLLQVAIKNRLSFIFFYRNPGRDSSVFFLLIRFYNKENSQYQKLDVKASKQTKSSLYDFDLTN